MKFFFLLVGTAAAAKNAIGAKRNFLKDRLDQMRARAGTKSKHASMMQTKSKLKAEEKMGKVPSEFFQKPTEYEVIQQNSAVGEVDANPHPDGPLEPEWFRQVGFPDEGVTGDYSAALVRDVDQLPVDLFNRTETKYTAFGFPEAELYDTQLMYDLSDRTGQPLHIEVVTEDPATMEAADEAAEAERAQQAVANNSTSAEGTMVTLEELDALNATAAQELVDSEEAITVVNSTSTSTDASTLIQSGASALGDVVGRTMNRAGNFLAQEWRQAEGLLQIHEVDVTNPI